MQLSLVDRRDFDSAAREDHNNVANVDPSVIQTLLDDIERLKKTIMGFTGSGSNRLGASKLDQVHAVVVGSAAKFDSAQWSRLSEQKQNELQEQLIMVRNTLLDMAQRNGHGELSEIADDSASTKSIIWLAIFAFIFAATLLSLIR